MSKTRLSRRSFLGSSTLAGAALLEAATYQRVAGANDRLGVGFIGYGLIGKRHVLDFRAFADVDPVAVAEVHQGRLHEAQKLMGPQAQGYADFRRLLDNKQVAAVVVSTPDHWHALQTMLACAAGKDVYVEKPLTLFVREGRWMCDVAQKYKRVVQVGTQQRSGKHYQRARQLLRDGRLGQITSVRMHSARNVHPGFHLPAQQKPPPQLDWNLWLGPAPLRPYHPLRALYHFRWFWDYSGGQMTNLASHVLDIVDWTLGLHTLQAVTSAGGRFCLRDGGETPDTQDALFEMGTWTATWSLREASRGEPSAFPLEFYGTNGSLGISRGGFKVVGDLDVPPANQIPQFADAHPVGGPQPVKPPRPPRPRTEPIEDRSGSSKDQLRDHARHFLDCIKTRQAPLSDLASAHRVATVCHLANISLRLGRKLRWDAAKETILGDDEAKTWLTRPYRAPWDKELQALGVG